jgi:putative transposase
LLWLFGKKPGMPWKETDAMNERSEFVLRAIATDNFRELCHEYGISPKTGYKWKERFLEEGLAGMAEQSRRPDKSPNGLGEAVVCEIIRIKEAHRTWGPRKIRELYARVHGRPVTPSESSFKRVLERAGLVEKRRLRKREESGRLHSGRRASAPNEVWTVDFKGSWHGAQGGRCEPLTVRDEYSRYVLDLRRLEDARTQTVRARFEELFRQHGLPGAIRSDNGPPFASVHGLLGLTRLSTWWLALGIDLERGRPGCPMELTSASTWTSHANWQPRAWAKSKRCWTSGERPLIQSVPTKLWACAARPRCTRARRKALAARSTT